MNKKYYFIVLTFYVFLPIRKLICEETTAIKNLAEQNKITILFTGNTNGSLEPCGCPGNKYGGMAQRMTLLKNEREKDHDLLLMDAGDFFPSTPNIYHPEPIIEIMNLMKYDIITLGDQEFINGNEYLKNIMPKMKFEIISSNIFYKDTGEKILPNSYLIKEIKSVKIGIIGVTSNKIFSFLPQEKINNILIKDPVESTQKIIQKLHKEVDILLVLSHQPLGENRSYAGTLYWIDAILGAHDGGLADNKSSKVNDIPILHPGRNGDHIIKLIFDFDKTNKKIKTLDIESIFVDKKTAKDAEIENIVKNYEKNTPLYADAMGKSKMLGANFCAKCHMESFNKWRNSGHYRALITIKKQKDVMHPNVCYPCHVTNLDSNDVYGIECETCHTIFKNHDSTRIKSEVKEEICLKCHTKEKSPNFDFKSYKEKMKH